MKFKSLDANIENIADAINNMHEELKKKSNKKGNEKGFIEKEIDVLKNDVKIEIQRIPLNQIFEELGKEKKVNRESVNRISNRIMLS